MTKSTTNSFRYHRGNQTINRTSILHQLSIFLFLFLCFTQFTYAQSPCNAHRWTSGDGWRYNTTTQKWEPQTLSSPNLQPKGIVRCASSAETEVQLQSFAAKYDPSVFAINSSLMNCFNQETETRGTTVTGPNTSKDIVWFNFDIRPLAGTYQFQIITNDQVGWALYYVNPDFAGPPATNTSSGTYPATVSELSGFTGNCQTDVSRLIYADCGISGNGWSTIKVPSFLKPSNYYLAMWPLTQNTFTNNLVYKSRYGCGGSTCFLEPDGNPVLTCTNGGYSVCQTYNGSAGKWMVVDNAAVKATSYTVTTYDQFGAVVSTASRSSHADLIANPLYVELGTITGNAPQNDIKAIVCATYASGNAYDISLTVSGQPAGAPNDYVDCTSSGRFNGNGLSTPTVTPGSYGPVCINGAAITLGGTPTGGVWSGAGVQAKQGGGYEFNPATAGEGSHTLTYSVAATSSTCASSNTTSIVVNPLATVTPGSYGPVCINAAIVALGGDPSGGTWSGTGVQPKQGGGFEFNPATAGAGTHILTYSVGATSTTCANSNTASIVVKPLATVTPGSYGPICIDAAAITLGGDPSGGIWSGTGVRAKQGGGYEFVPSIAGAGDHVLTYAVSATSTTCANSNTTSITVTPLATVTPGTYGPVCIDADKVALGGTPSGGTWSGAGVQAKQGGGFEFNPAIAGTGSHMLTYAVGTTASACANSNTTSIVVNGKPTVGVNSPTICEGESVTLTATGASSYSWSPSTNLSATTGASVTASPSSTITYTVTGTDGNACTNTANSTVTVNKCSRIQLEKLTNGVVDPTKTWQFTISGGDLTGSVTQSVLNDGDGILFENVLLSKNQKYTICETNVPAGYSITLQYRDANGAWQNIAAYDPNVVSGGGDFNQGEAVGNYCFTIGAGTAIALPGNTYESNTTVYLRIKINNIPPPMGNARTPGYWKNWNTCTGGNQVATAAKNGGSANGFWLMDNHLPHTMWTKTVNEMTSSFIITSCLQGVAILDERQFGTNQKMSSDAAYKLAKHLFAYQLNKKSGTYNCAAAAMAATQAEALLAKYGFNGTGSVYLSSKDKAKKADYDLALQLAKTLDAYNNNLPCSNAITSNAITSVSKEIAPDEIDAGLQVSTSPNPYRDRIRLSFQSKVSGQGSLDVFNLMGQKVKTLYQGRIEAGQTRMIDYAVPIADRTDLIYILRVGDKLSTGKILKQK